MSIVRELFLGNLSPDNIFQNTKTPEHVKAARLRDGLGEKLEKTLSEEEKELLEKYRSAQDDVSFLDYIAYFTSGLRFGVLLMSEVYVEVDL